MQRPTTTYILDQIALHAQEQPDATAIEHGSRRVTYGELPSLIHREASVLREFGFPAGSPVMVALPRGPEQVVTMLALWSAGLAFLPVDPSDPAARLAEIHNATGAVATILASEDPAAGAGATRLDVHDSAARSSGGLAASAYVIFTSGSTGTPKGVVASHEAFVSLIALLVERYAITPADRVLQFAAPTFDTALEQIGVTLAAGAALIQPDSLWAPSEFANLLVRHRVSVMDLTPSYWRAVAAFESASLPHDTDQVRLVILGGAAVSNQDLLSVHDRYGQARIINAYGLSETGITSCLSEPDMTTLSPRAPPQSGKRCQAR